MVIGWDLKGGYIIIEDKGFGIRTQRPIPPQSHREISLFKTYTHTYTYLGRVYDAASGPKRERMGLWLGVRVYGLWRVMVGCTWGQD